MDAPQRIRWGGWLVLAVLLFALARESAVRTVDFPVYHRVAREMLSGDFTVYPSQVYDGTPIPSHGFRYAPVIAFLMMPIGWLPLPAGALLLFALKLLAAVYIASVVARRAGLPPGQRGYLLAAFFVVAGYIAEEFRYGNVHFLTVALMVFALDRAESGQRLRPALALGLAIAAKLTPLALVGYFAVRRRVAVCVATLGVLVALMLAPALVVGVEANARLLRGFATYALQKVDEQDNYALRGTLVRHLTTQYVADVSHVPASIADMPPGAVTVIWVLGLIGLGVAGLVVIAPESREPLVRLLEWSIVITGIVLAAPHTQRRYFVALYLPAAVLLAVVARSADADARRASWLGLGATAASGTLLPLVFGGRRLALMYEAMSPYFFGALALLASLLLVTARLKRQERGAGGIV